MIIFVRQLSALFVHLKDRPFTSTVNKVGRNLTISVYPYLCKSCSHHSASPYTMKLETPEFKGILTPELNTLVELFKKHDYDIRIAGGAVRDLLMGLQPVDIDFATTATPDEMKDMFNENSIRMINAKGEKHGTITARINESNFEITTLRTDLITDGRHAVVEFTKDWHQDANRRDLTINSMFLGLDGTVYDYFNGHKDLKKRRIIFVGDASTRIKEDYLRILRYFRFYGRISEKENDHDETTINSIKENIQGLERISGERIWTELSKITVGKFAPHLIEKLVEVGASKYIGLPESPNLTENKTVLKRAEGYNLKPITVITTLFNNCEEFNNFHSRCKLSSAERNLGILLIEFRSNKEPFKFYQRLLVLPSSTVTRDQISQLFIYKGDYVKLSEFEAWPTPRFPISGKHITTTLGIPQGKALGNVMNKLRHIWIDQDFKPSQDELLKEAETIVEELNIRKN